MTQSSTDVAAAPPLPPKERRRLREAKSLSEEQVAMAVGVTRATVRSWATGRTTPRGRKGAVYARLISGGRKGRQATPSSARTKSTASSTRPKAAVKRVARPAMPTTVARLSKLSKPVTSTKPPSRPPTPVEATGSSAMAPTEPGTTPDLPGTPDASGASEAPGATAPAVEAPAEAAVEAETTQGTTAAETAAVAAAEAAAVAAEAAAIEGFDALYKHCAAALFRQTFLLTGRRSLSQESVARAFALAWDRWPEVAADRDPVGWVRAAAYEYAMSPWHRLRRTHRELAPPPAEPGARVLLDALLDLPPSYRRTLLLHDGVGLGLPETAAETEASTPATASRLMNARAAVAERLTELAEPSSPAEQSALLHQQLGTLAEAQIPDSLPSPDVIRTDSEHRAQLWTRAAISFAVLLVGATLFTLATAPTRYETPESPALQVEGVPPRSGPQKLTPQDLNLRNQLRGEVVQGPARLLPHPG
ncbi:helix-turn-helix domain-containing protein [Streptomyces sp. NBC_01618]|uniref:helix-turn-helix domain-containing protein n=1 Tax=Streptomyces sp. NBC_01618 TaxID=2975900 RepID=UPI00386AFF41|nr:helix-turn-helix domain-containing protein [Streptomyces sp. NBC_01618]